MRYGSVCSGIESATAAWHPLGWEPVWFSEIEPFPCRVLKHHYPNVPNLGDMLKLRENEVFQKSAIDLLVGGTPCFSSDTLIMTSSGFVKISDIKIGDLVLTHKKRWKKVLRVGAKMSDTIDIFGQGGKLRTTHNHRFFASKVSKKWNNDRRVYELLHASPDWITAENMCGNKWLIPSEIEELRIPEIRNEGNEKSPFTKISAEIAYLIGRWLGDGWLRIAKRRSYVLICCGHKETLSNHLKKANINYSCSKERTTLRYQIANSAFAKWIFENFSEKAAGKKLPGWVFGASLEIRQAIFRGYLDADGTKAQNGYKSTSISKKLSVGMGILATSLGYCFSITETKPKRTCVIEGRAVNERSNYVVSYYNRSRSAFLKEGYMYGLVRKIEQNTAKELVYDLEVEEDHSYTANGVAVHNCQSFSIAGLRGGLADSRGNLALEFCRILDEKRPRWFCWENVPGVFSSSGGRDFAAILRGFRKCGYSCAWRVLDAQFFGVPQRRRRVFVVGYLGDDWRPSATVLFEPQGMRRHPAEGRKEGQEIAGTLDESIGRSRGAGTNPGSIVSALTRRAYADNESHEEKLIVHSLRGGGHDGSEDGTGRGTPLVPYIMATGQGNAEIDRNLSPSLNCDHEQPILFSIMPMNSGKDYKAREVEVTQPLTTQNGNQGNQGGDIVVAGPTVRRLTPLECERLQGFPDGYTAIPGAKDSPRYSSIGNSMARPVMAWIGRRIDHVDKQMTRF